MASTFQLHLDIQMQCDLTAHIWKGEYVTPQADATIPAIGQADQGVGAHVHMHVDHNILYVVLQSKPSQYRQQARVVLQSKSQALSPHSDMPIGCLSITSHYISHYTTMNDVDT